MRVLKRSALGNSISDTQYPSVEAATRAIREDAARTLVVLATPTWTLALDDGYETATYVLNAYGTLRVIRNTGGERCIDMTPTTTLYRASR